MVIYDRPLIDDAIVWGKFLSSRIPADPLTRDQTTLESGFLAA